MRGFKSFCMLAIIATAALLLSADALPAPDSGCCGKIVVADRDDGTISVIDVRTDQLSGTYSLPADVNPPEPMYVTYIRAHRRVLVGDRANNRVVAFSAKDFGVQGTVDAGAGVFHMWSDTLWNRQLWVNNDIDNTTTVIDPRNLTVLGTVDTPADLVAQGGKPHDVILDPLGFFAYVSVVGIPGNNDYVVQYSTRSFAEIRRAAVGKDPHLSLATWNSNLFVPCQSSDTVYVLNRRTLAPVKEIAVPGAHGAAMTGNGRYFYTTNLPGGGVDGLYTVDARRLKVVGDPVDTPYAVPHNIALTSNGRKLYVTHSEASNKVTIYTIRKRGHRPVYSGEVTAGATPFGLAYVPKH